MPTRPTILIVVDDAELRGRLAEHLRRRYEPDYAIAAAPGRRGGDHADKRSARTTGGRHRSCGARRCVSGLGVMAEANRADPATRRIMLVPRGGGVTIPSARPWAWAT
jgi:hypothetical protein